MSTKMLCVLSTVLVCVVAGSCGYRLARFDNPEIDGFTTIAIPYFQNKSYEPGIDAIFTHAFVNKFIETGRLRVVGVDEADLVLRGTIRRVDSDSLALAADRRALEWRVWVTLGIVVEERMTGRVIWSRSSLRHGEEYRVGSGDIQLDEADKRRAFQLLAADLAEQAHDGFMQGF